MGYNIIISLYLMGVVIASFFSKKVRTMWRGERRAIKDIKAKLDPTAQYVWVHAASLGEFEQGRTIIERLKKESPDIKILLTFFSPSGYEVRKNYKGADIICYLPIDTPLNARRFLRTIRPVSAIFIKYEFWYNYMHILRHRGVPVYSVSSIFREGQIFFRWYGRSYAHVLKCFTHFFVQNDKSKELLATIGIHNVTVSGDTRFDRVLQIASEAQPVNIAKRFAGDKRVFVAGSSWQPDEEVFIPYFNEHKDWKLIIAPHVISESHVRQIETLLKGRKVVKYTDAVAGTDVNDADVLIINCFGLLSSIYQYADVTYVGGGFGVGIHNVLEAAVWKKPVIFGPNNKKFQEAHDLIASGGGFEFLDSLSFKNIMDRFIADRKYLSECSEKAGNFVDSRAGATAAVIKAFGLSED